MRCAILLLAMVALCGCLRIPVEVHPPDAEDGKGPLALPVAPVGVEQPQADGSVRLNPDLRQPTASDHPPAPGIPWGTIGTAAIALLTGAGGAALPLMARARTALRAVREAATYADEVERAEDDSAVKAAKLKARAAQEAAGVRGLIQRVRGRA